MLIYYVLNFELEFKFTDEVGMLRRKEIYQSKAVCFSYCMVVSSFSYDAYSVQTFQHQATSLQNTARLFISYKAIMYDNNMYVCTALRNHCAIVY